MKLGNTTYEEHLYMAQRKRDDLKQRAQGTDGFLLLTAGFVVIVAVLCNISAGTEALEQIDVHKVRVAAVGSVPVQDKSDPLGCGDHWPCVLGWHP